MENELLKRLKSSGSIKSAEVLSKSIFFNKKTTTKTDLPIINIAFSGDLNGGLLPGVTVFAGESKTFKTLLALYCLKAYQKEYPNSIAIIYDSEFGITPEYLRNYNIDITRILHIPIEHVEQLKFDFVKRLESINRGDKVFIMIDSLGALASKKEIDDAIDSKSVADMTRAKSIRSFLRIVTPHLTIKDLPCMIVNHVYQTQEIYSKTVIPGGTAVTYSANQVFVISKKQDKNSSNELLGYNFTITIDKSRFVREKSKFSFNASFENGIEKYSGLMDIALEAGVVIKPNQGFYQKIDLKTGEPEGNKMRLKDTNTKEFWDSILQSKEFNDYIKQRYQLGYNSLIADDVSNNFIENSKNEENENDQTRFE
jgi:RecA/RadA recombinase